MLSMLCVQNLKKILLLQKMCEQYWPEDGKTVEYGDICILNLKQTVYADHIHRIFQLTSRSATESRKVIMKTTPHSMTIPSF